MFVAIFVRARFLAVVASFIVSEPITDPWLANERRVSSWISWQVW
jgi:hypothetical protein